MIDMIVAITCVSITLILYRLTHTL